jgi:hypothetical protein
MNTYTPSIVGVGLAALLSVVIPATARAQTEPGADTTAQFQFGRFSFSPAVVALAGYDSNMTRETPVAEKGGEYYAIPEGRVWYRVSSVLLSGAGAAEYIWAADVDRNAALTGAPKANLLGEGTFDVSGRVVSLSGVASFKRTNARPTGFEVGARSVRIERDLEATAAIEAGDRVGLSFYASRLRTEWDADAIYQGWALATYLNSRYVTVGTDVGYELTPVTSVFARVEWRDERFYLEPTRDNRSTVAGGGVSFSGLGWLRGSVWLGKRTMHYAQQYAGDVGGMIVSGTVQHVRPSGSSFTVNLRRDKLPSYDLTQRQYGFGTVDVLASTTVFERWNVYASGSFSRLSYAMPDPRHEDHVTFGGGMSFRPQPRMRIGFQAERYRHQPSSGAVGQRYSGFFAGAFIIYGITLTRPLDRPIPF